MRLEIAFTPKEEEEEQEEDANGKKVQRRRGNEINKNTDVNQKLSCKTDGTFI